MSRMGCKISKKIFFCLGRSIRKWDVTNSNSTSAFQPFACLGSQKLGPALREHENISDAAERSFF